MKKYSIALWNMLLFVEKKIRKKQWNWQKIYSLSINATNVVIVAE